MLQGGLQRRVQRAKVEDLTANPNPNPSPNSSPNPNPNPNPNPIQGG